MELNLVQKEIIEKLLKYKEVVSKHFNIEKMFLYGSFARGNPQKYSDIDVAFVVKELNDDFFSYAPLLWKLRIDIDQRIEPIMFIEGKDPSGFLGEIIRTGIEIN